MDEVQSLSLDLVDAKEILPGFHGKFIHSDRMTLAYWSIDEFASLPEHAHPHEQIVNLLEGKFELTVDGTVHFLKPGDVVVIPGNVPHMGRAITQCRILDVFQPARDDYR
ncbi:MAG: cupin domain-containing protein [Mariniblastus sp.]